MNLLLLLPSFICTANAFTPTHFQPCLPTRLFDPSRSGGESTTCLHEMKRPILDRAASFVFKLENDRVANSSEIDDQGRSGEPMAWAESTSFANKFSEAVASNDLGYRFKQTVADLVAGDYDEEATNASILSFISSTPVAMYSFSTCPFCRMAKDYLDEQKIPYEAIELDLLPENQGNEIRSTLGKTTRRTSVPSIFIGGECIGGCNDGPGLLPLAQENKLNPMLEKARKNQTLGFLQNMWLSIKL